MSLGQVQLTIKAGKSSTMGLPKKRKRGPGRKKSDETVIHPLTWAPQGETSSSSSMRRA